MQSSHTSTSVSASFDDPNLTNTAGLEPLLRLAENAGLKSLADAHLTLPGDKGSNAGAKLTSLIAAMACGADSIDDTDLIRHGATGTLFTQIYAPSTLGSFLRTFTFGHVRQLDAVASRLLEALAVQHPKVMVTEPDDYVYLDIDDSVQQVYGHAKQGTAYGYTRVRGLDWLLATMSTSRSAPLVVGQRLRKGSANSARGAPRIVSDSVRTAHRVLATTGNNNAADAANESPRVLTRLDSGFYTHQAVSTALKNGAQVSATARMTSTVKKAIATIDEDAWRDIVYTNEIRDPDTDEIIRGAQIAEIDFTAFTSHTTSRDSRGKHKPFSGPIPGRLVVRRVKELNKDRLATAADKNNRGEQLTMFDLWRFHPFFTTVPRPTAEDDHGADAGALDTVAIDLTHRKHAIIEQVHEDLKASALAHLPSGKFAANSAWLVAGVMAFNLTRVAGVLAGGGFARAETATVRARLINLAARVSRSARRVRLHLPKCWKWQQAWMRLFDRVHSPPVAA